MRSNFAIVISGGPAPGINSLINSVVIEGINRGYGVKGFQSGFEGLLRNPKEAVTDLTIPDVSGIAHRGGSVLGTSRVNPLRDEASEKALGQVLKDHRIDKLIVVGGDGSAHISLALSERFPDLKVAHIPKTIDNDLPLPNNYSTIGYATAQHVGASIVQTLMEDARTVRKRWFIVTTMGRSAGFLALGIGLAAGATLTLIPEEFEKDKISVEELAALIVRSIEQRHRMGRGYGVALLAEGILDKLSPVSSPLLANCPRDDLGRLEHHQLEIGELLLPIIRDMCKKKNINIKTRHENIGYELRCADPIAFDIEYTRYLGVGAVNYLLQGLSGIMIVRDHNSLSYVHLRDLAGESHGIRSRLVDLNSDLFCVARSFMVR